MTPESPAAPHTASPAELKERFEAERRGTPFLIYRHSNGRQHLFSLDDTATRITVGRRSSADIWIDWDHEVSRLHAALERVGDDWLLVDDGISSNGSFVNGQRVTGRHRLRDGDTIRVGQTLMIYRSPEQGESRATNVSAALTGEAAVSETQRRVLIALCRPFKDSAGYATPATNQQIADELFLSVDAVKTHLRALFQKFELADLPQNQKRARLVEVAFQLGIVSERDL